MKIKQQKNLKYISLPVLILCAAAIFAGCQEKEENPSLYSSGYFHNGAAPVIDTIIGMNGDASKLASIALLKFVGKNFSTNPADNLVNFNNVRGTVVSATATELVVRAPNYANDTIWVRVDIAGGSAALAPSNSKFYPLQQPLFEDKILTAQELPLAMVCDGTDNLIISTTNANGGPGGIVKIDPAGNKTVLLAADKQQQAWKDAKIANGGNLYLSGPLRAIKLLRNGGTALENYAVFPAGDGIVTLNAMDFDASLTLWTGGESASKNFYSVTSTSPVVITPFSDFNGTIKALRVFNGYLYIGGKLSTDTTYKIFRYQIVSNTQLGPQQVYYNFGASYPGKQISSMTFSQDGYLYVGVSDGTGLNSAPGMVLIAPNASAEDYYSGALIPAGSLGSSAGYFSLMWSGTKFLWAGRVRQYTGGTAAAPVTVTETKLVKINALKNGAVYYGR